MAIQVQRAPETCMRTFLQCSSKDSHNLGAFKVGACALVSMAGAVKFVTALSLRTPGSQLQPCVGTCVGEPLPIHQQCAAVLSCMLRRQQLHGHMGAASSADRRT